MHYNWCNMQCIINDYSLVITLGMNRARDTMVTNENIADVIKEILDTGMLLHMLRNVRHSKDKINYFCVRSQLNAFPLVF